MAQDQHSSKPNSPSIPIRLSESFVVNDQGEEISLLDYLTKHPGEVLKVGDKEIQIRDPMQTKSETSLTESDRKQKIEDWKMDTATRLYGLSKDRAKRRLLKKLEQIRAQRPTK